MDQPAGTTKCYLMQVIEINQQTIYRELIVKVLETTKKYEPVAGTKVDIADSNGVGEN